MFRLTVFATLFTGAFCVICQNPSAYYGQVLGHPRAFKCPGGRDGQCVAAVMKLCSPLGSGPTSTWRKGVKVVDNCATLPRNAAIATFPNGATYEGHAAIFLECVPGGIKVADQWCNQPFHERIIRKGRSGVSNNANGFYAIN